VPANVTTAPVLSFCKSIALADGAAMLDRMMFVQDATADEIAL